MIKAWTTKAWDDYLYWYNLGNKRNVRQIHKLLKDIERGDPYTGIGKPEPLKHDLSGLWSRRITQEHRLIYDIDGVTDTIRIYACRYHYS